MIPPPPWPARRGGLQITFIEEHTEPQAEQRERILQALTVLQRQSKNLRISASLPTQDFYLRRAVYTRLWVIRSLALEAGFTVARVQIAVDTVPQAPTPRQNITLYAYTVLNP